MSALSKIFSCCSHAALPREESDVKEPDPFPYKDLLGREYFLQPPELVAGALTLMMTNSIESPEFIPGHKAWDRIERLAKNLDAPVIKEALELNYRECIKGNPRSGTCFHALLKMAIKSDYVIPANIVCDAPSLDAAIRQCFGEFASHPEPTRIIEIALLTLSAEPLERGAFLPQMDLPIFLNFAIQSLVAIPFEKWRNKDKVIIHFLTLDRAKDFAGHLVNQLCLSKCDEKTLKIGRLCTCLLQPSRDLDRFSVVEQLFDLLPCISREDIKQAFGYDLSPQQDHFLQYRRQQMIRG